MYPCTNSILEMPLHTNAKPRKRIHAQMAGKLLAHAQTAACYEPAHAQMAGKLLAHAQIVRL